MKRICIYIIIVCNLFANLYGKTHSVLIHPAPVADFEISAFCLGELTYFYNTTKGGVFYTWNIYSVDSNYVNTDTLFTSSVNSPEFLFPATGNYKVELIADNGHIVSIEKYIYVDSIPTSNFDYKPCTSQFNNLSVCFNSCFWDFGDGHTSIEVNPQHYYAIGGNYSVKLITKKDNRTDTIINSILGRSNGLDSTFTIKVFKDSVLYYMNDTGAIVTSDSILVLFQTNDTITGPYTSFHWSFGDDQVADLYGFNGGRKVYHRYANLDIVYTVFFLARASCANSFSTQNFSFYDHPKIAQQTIGLSVFPNPVSENTLHITTDRKSELSKIIVLNYLSQPISNSNTVGTENGFDVDVSNLSSGLYFIRMFFGNEILTRKIIKD
jgi:hypothetical protein